jgi:hypothetical protein
MSDLARAFAGMREAREPERVSTQVPKRASTHAPEKSGPKLEPRRAPLPLQGTAKSTHPEYTAVKIFVRRETHKAAGRKAQDDGIGDFSDLVEGLLQKYLSTGGRDERDSYQCAD